jgi:hypothetical protein
VLVIAIEVIRIDGGSLVGGVVAGHTTGQAGLDRFAKVTRVITAPGILDLGVLGKRLAVTTMQALPALLQRRAGIGVGLFGIGKFVPSHDLPPDA